MSARKGNKINGNSLLKFNSVELLTKLKDALIFNWKYVLEIDAVEHVINNALKFHDYLIFQSFFPNVNDLL